MKKYNLKPTQKLHVVGQVTFIYDKAFQNKFDKYPKFVPAKNSVYLMNNETEEQVIEYIKKYYNNPRDFKTILKNI